MRRVAGIAGLAVLMLLPSVAAGQTGLTLESGEGDRVVAERAVTAPTIDGSDADAVWRSAERVSDFRQLEPDDAEDPSMRTEFRVGYDDRNLYVYVRAFDAHPDSILRALTRRDVRGPSAEIAILIDSYRDRRTGYEFAVNPDGVKRDLTIYDDSSQDGSWDAVWEVATVVDSAGWAAEFRIPLSQLRYPDAESHVFGFGVFREIERNAERVSWPAMDRDTPGLASQLGTVEGLSGLTGARALEVTPYTVAKSETVLEGTAGYERDRSVSIGADLKYRITPNITLDATVNPDFGQVEADPAVLNLTAFETFLREQRPFFVEGTGLYRFELNCYIVVDCSTNEGLFYSRRIGRSPHLRDSYGEAGTPTATPIAVATKLTGRTEGGLSFGLLDAVTRRVGGVDDATVEPRTNYAVFSAEQDMREGEAGVRLIATAVNRATDAWTSPYLHDSAYTAGLSARNRMLEGNYEVEASLALSRVAGSAAAIDRTQRSAVHYFQQPGDGLELDATRTSLSGHAAQIKFGKYGGGITRFETSLVRQSAGFEVNDLGYLRRADVQDWSTWAALRFNTPTRFYNWFQINGNHWETWSTSGMRLQSAFNTNFHLGLPNNWDIHAGATLDDLWGSYCDRCTRGGPPLRESTGLYPWFGVNADSRRMLAPSMWINLGFDDEGETSSVAVEPQLAIRFATGLDARIGMHLVRNVNHTQWVDNVTGDDGSAHHVFAHLDQRTVSMSLRLNYTAAPGLTFEFYGEPFVSTGTYSQIREVSATPGARKYEDRFRPYEPPASLAEGFRFRQLRTNSVVRWEYLPGSTLYVVWAHGREASANHPSTGRWTDEYRDLFTLHPENTFLVKLAYWFGR